MAEQVINQIIISENFANWLSDLKNPIAKATVSRRIKNATKGNFGDHKLLTGTGGVYEMRIDTGKGYRVYYAQQGEVIYILLHGGDKSKQQNDIEKASLLWAELKQKQTGDNNGNN
ncbi:type II toxin-antitoxin system RelE/ParE family toxin [Ursidibacter arcticus]